MGTFFVVFICLVFIPPLIVGLLTAITAWATQSMIRAEDLESMAHYQATQFA